MQLAQTSVVGLCGVTRPFAAFVDMVSNYPPPFQNAQNRNFLLDLFISPLYRQREKKACTFSFSFCRSQSVLYSAEQLCQEKEGENKAKAIKRHDTHVCFWVQELCLMAGDMLRNLNIINKA